MHRIAAVFVLGLSVVTTAFAIDWPQWRGPDRDGISKETGLLQEWPADGPPLRWRVGDLGTGYSTPAVVKGRVYLQTTRDNDEFALVLDEKSGQQVWQAAIGKVGENRGMNYPGTRSTPNIDGDRTYCLASAGELVCLETATGKPVWQKHLKHDFSGEPGNWAYAESVLIDGDALICTPGGESATIVALNKATGDVLWKASVPGGSAADYASPMISHGGNVKQYVRFLRKGVVGVEAKTGRLLWQYAHTVDQGANMITPIVSGNRIFTAGSRSGGGTIELIPEGDGVTAKEVYFDRRLASAMGGAVLVEGRLYAASGQALFCADFATGNVLWTERAVGPASICYADHRLYVRGHGNAGEVVLVEPSADGYHEKGRLKQPDRSNRMAWSHPVVANGGLYLLDQGNLFCYDVAKK